MKINGMDITKLEHYDYKTLKKICDTGKKYLSSKSAEITKNDVAFLVSAGHALDLVEILRDKPKFITNIEGNLDFTIDTQKNVGGAAYLLFMMDIIAGVPEQEVRNRVAKKVSSYLLFEIWNFYYQVDKDGIETDLILPLVQIMQQERVLR